MNLVSAELDKRAFRLHGEPLTFVPYQSQAATLEFLHDVYACDRGLAVLHGPSLRGKTTLMNRFADAIPSAAAVAFIDCGRLNTSTFLASILAQFGFEPEAPTVNEQLKLLKTFLVQRSATDRAPLLIIDNANKIDLKIYHCLDKLLATRYRDQRVIRVVLVGSRSLRAILMASVMQKGLQISEWRLQPMTLTETADYVSAKLGAAGCDNAEKILPGSLIEEIYQDSQGYPGLVDWSILRRLQEAHELPLCRRRDGIRFAGGRQRRSTAAAGLAYAPIPMVSRGSHTSASSIRPDAE